MANELNKEEVEKLKDEFETIRKQAQEAADEVKKLHENLPSIIKGLSRPGIDFSYDPETGKIAVDFSGGETMDDDFDE